MPRACDGAGASVHGDAHRLRDPPPAHRASRRLHAPHRATAVVVVAPRSRHRAAHRYPSQSASASLGS